MTNNVYSAFFKQLAVVLGARVVKRAKNEPGIRAIHQYPTLRLTYQFTVKRISRQIAKGGKRDLFYVKL